MKQKTPPMPRVSIIISTYNRADLLRLTIESVFEQTYPNIELIVVDDGSTDHTAEMLKGYGERLIYHYQQNEGYEAAAWKAVTKLATGDYIGFLDHDDLFLPTKIEKQVQFLNSNPDYDIVICRHYVIDIEGKIFDRVGLLPEGDVLRNLIEGDFIWSGAPLMRREPLLKVAQPISTPWTADWSRWLSFAIADYKVGCIQELLGCYRVVSGSMMSKLDKLEESTFKVLDTMFSDPRLPGDILADKEQIYASMHLWISCSYYTLRQWEDAKRNLRITLDLDPNLAQKPVILVSKLVNNAFNPRVSDPLDFTESLIANLPPEAAFLSRYQARLTAEIHLGIALREFASQNFDSAREHIVQAVHTDSSLLQDEDKVIEMLSACAIHLPVDDPIDYVQTVFDNWPETHLPPTSVSLRSRVLSNVHVIMAFENYAQKQWSDVLRNVTAGIKRNSAWIKNRGVISIFGRSMIKSLMAMTNVL